MTNAFRSTLILAGILLSSCSTAAKVTSLSDLPKLSGGATGIALPIKLQSSSPLGSDGCTLLISRSPGLKMYEIDFNPGSDVVAAELPPGVYGFRGINCGGRRWDLTLRDWPRFQVFPGKLSMLGGVSVYLNENDSMSVDRSNRAASRDEALSFLGRIPTESRANVVSAYTGQAISGPGIESPARWRNWELTDAEGKEVKKGDRQWPSFQACYRGEGDVNSLWLGNLKFEMDYDKAQLVETKQADSWSSFSSHFVDCVKSSIKEFRPKSQEHLHYVIYI
jgi:hypothetical protein